MADITVNVTDAQPIDVELNGVVVKVFEAESFTDLSDVPSSYVGQGNKKVSVKADQTGLEFVADVPTAWGSITGTLSDQTDLQNALNTKANLSGGNTFTGTQVYDDQTADRIAIFGSSKNLQVASTATYPSLTELTYLKGVTSAIQVQINSKANLPAANGIVVRTGAGTTTNRTITGTANQITVTNGDGVSGNPTLSLPQDIATTSTPQFARLGLGVAATGVIPLSIAFAASFNSEGNSGFRILNAASGADVSLQMGADTTNDVGYIQAMQPGVAWTTRPLTLQANGGVVSIGTTGTAGRLTVQGSGATSSTSSLFVRNSASTELFSIRDDGLIYGRQEIVVGVSGIASTGYLTMQTAATGNYTGGTTGAVGKLEFYNSGASNTGTSAQIIAGRGRNVLGAGMLVFRTASSLGVVNDVASFTHTGSFLVGDSAFIQGTNGDARVVIRGAGATSSTSGLIVEDSAGLDILLVRNDGIVRVGSSTVIQTIPGGTGSAVTPQLSNMQVSGVAAMAVGIQDGTNNQRLGMFADQPNGIVGISSTFGSGAPAFVYREASAEVYRILSGNFAIGTTTTTGARFTVRGSGTSNTASSLLIQDSANASLLTIRNDGGFAFKGGTVGLAQTGWTTSNVTTDRTLDANSTTLDEVADVLATLIEDLKTKAIISA